MTDIDLELEKGIYVYQIELYQGGYEYDLVLNAKDGARISLKSEKDDWDENGGWVHHTGRNPVTTEQTQAKAQEKPTQQNGASSYIGVAKAKEIVLQKVPGATITKIELERDDGRVAYEGEAQRVKWSTSLISTLTPVRSSLGKKSKAITAAAAHSLPEK